MSITEQKVLFIDRDGTLIIEPPSDYQVDSLDKLEFYPGVFYWLRKIVNELDYKLVMVTNQDGLGTETFPEDTFWPAHSKMMKAFENENIFFNDVFIDSSFEAENSPNRKPRTGMLSKYIYGNYDLSNSFVIGDRESDLQLAHNMGCQGIFINKEASELALLNTEKWEDIYKFLSGNERKANVSRKTKETNIEISLNLDGEGKSNICTGLGFFDHMLEQIAKHGDFDLDVKVEGDLEIDEHHTVEDVGLALGTSFVKALGTKKAIERYGFVLPMDDCLAQVALDFGGRPYFNWSARFKREMVGDVPTEMFSHFFKSFSDTSLSNLNIKAEGENEHHKIEAIFKSFAKALKMAVAKNSNFQIPSSKGVL